MTSLQRKLLEMMTWLDKYLREQSLTYYVFNGTLLGAARHKGFIPWDDDLDIAMPRSDYAKLCESLKEPMEHYVVESTTSDAEDFVYTFAKLYDTSTSMTELLRKRICRGVYIDIFPLDGIGNNYKESVKNYKAIDRRNAFLMTRVCAYRKDRKWYKNLALIVSRCIPSFLVNEKQMAIDIDKISQKYSYDDCKYVSYTTSVYRERDIHKRELFGKPIELQFENIKVLAPKHYDEILTDTYGDWRQLPPIEKRKTAHDFIDLDLNKSYLNGKEK